MKARNTRVNRDVSDGRIEISADLIREAVRYAQANDAALLRPIESDRREAPVVVAQYGFGRYRIESVAEAKDPEAADFSLASLRAGDAGYLAFERVLQHCEAWRDPDTGQAIGELIATWDELPETYFVEGHAYLSCLQWTADLAGIPLRIEVQFDY